MPLNFNLKVLRENFSRCGDFKSAFFVRKLGCNLYNRPSSLTVKRAVCYPNATTYLPVISSNRIKKTSLIQCKILLSAAGDLTISMKNNLRTSHLHSQWTHKFHYRSRWNILKEASGNTASRIRQVSRESIQTDHLSAISALDRLTETMIWRDTRGFIWQWNHSHAGIARRLFRGRMHWKLVESSPSKT